MAQNLYITATSPKSGKSIVALGLMEMTFRSTEKVGFFRPIIAGNRNDPTPDRDITLIREYFNLDIEYNESFAYTISEANDLISSDREAELIDGILDKYRELEKRFDFILIEGTDFEGITSAFEFDINADIALNLNAPLLIIQNGKSQEPDNILANIRIAIESFEDRGLFVLGTIINRVEPVHIEDLRLKLDVEFEKSPTVFYTMPENEILGNPALSDIVAATNAKVLFGHDQLHWHAHHYIVAAMQLRNFIPALKDGALVITPWDRADIILGALTSAKSIDHPKVAGIVLTGGRAPEDSIMGLISGLTDTVPIMCIDRDTYSVAEQMREIEATVSPTDNRMVATALGTFNSCIDTAQLAEKIKVARSEKITPKMFEYRIIEAARAVQKHIVLPEGNEDRILQAAEILRRRDVVKITLLGNKNEIRKRISLLHLSKLDDVNIINPVESELLEDYAQAYFEARRHKGITLDRARDTISDVSYFATMMVQKGHADGMVSGSVNTTQHTIRPAFEFVRTKPGISIVSSVFFMCLPDKVLVYGDCAVNPNPTAEQLAEIAIASSETAASFNIEPRVAMLSYSTGASGKGEEVEKVREATRIARERAPELKIEGPIQYDAAVEPSVAATKMPNSEVAGKATVLIFPDLNTGNNTYKAVQRSANAVAIGPVLQGLNKPVNDLSRGCTVPDIVNTIAITAIQAGNQSS